MSTSRTRLWGTSIGNPAGSRRVDIRAITGHTDQGENLEREASAPLRGRSLKAELAGARRLRLRSEVPALCEMAHQGETARYFQSANMLGVPAADLEQPVITTNGKIQSVQSLVPAAARRSKDHPGEEGAHASVSTRFTFVNRRWLQTSGGSYSRAYWYTDHKGELVGRAVVTGHRARKASWRADLIPTRATSSLAHHGEPADELDLQGTRKEVKGG